MSEYIAVFNRLLTSGRYRESLSVLKGIRNGIVYGVKIRFPHALVMTLLFKRTNWKEMIKSILKATYQHAKSLGQFVFTYKLLTSLLSRASAGKKEQWFSFVAAFVGGYLIFGENNPINMQINMYLLSRIIFGFCRLASKNNYLPNGDTGKGGRDYFRLYAALVWGIVLWMFEYHRGVLQPSLQNSMTYLYDDSNVWHDIRDFLIWNKQ